MAFARFVIITQQFTQIANLNWKLLNTLIKSSSRKLKVH